MSWSVSTKQKAAEAAIEIERQFKNSGPCVDPEESVRQSARITIAAALSAQHPDVTVNVSAFGSQGKTDGKTMNSLSIIISAEQ